MEITLEKVDNYRGMTYAITHLDFYGDMSWRCGYVAIPDDHPLHGVDYTDIDEELEVHGGLTYSRESLTVDTNEPYTWWLGFDTNHWGDNQITQSLKYVEEECKKLIDQIVEEALGEEE